VARAAGGRPGEPSCPRDVTCHAGHLDIARELLDGRVDLGLR
jgi:hypothetical protein